MPARGPQAYQRTSFAIFISAPARVRRAPLTLTMPSCAESAANLLGAETNGLAGFLCDSPGGHFAEAGIGIEACANCRASDCQRVNPGQSLANAVERLVELRYPAGDQLAEGERCRVLKVRPPHHDNIAISLGFLVEDVTKPAYRRNQAVFDRLDRGNVHRGWKGIVRRLTVIHIIIGMNRLLRADRAASKLDRPVGDHFVGVHVGLRAGTGLEHNQRKLFVPSAVDHLLRGTHDQIDFFLRRAGPVRRWPGPHIFSGCRERE